LIPSKEGGAPIYLQQRGVNVRDAGKGADEGVFPTAFWLREYTWVVLCSGPQERVCLTWLLGNGVSCLRHRGKTIDMRGIFVEARAWFLGIFRDMGGDIEHRRRPLLSPGVMRMDN
jgi:hypothetical protein